MEEPGEERVEVEAGEVGHGPEVDPGGVGGVGGAGGGGGHGVTAAGAVRCGWGMAFAFVRAGVPLRRARPGARGGSPGPGWGAAGGAGAPVRSSLAPAPYRPCADRDEPTPRYENPSVILSLRSGVAPLAKPLPRPA
ncbi:hypothetical protein GCM10010305_41190 [Streptomyces termitum]|uniref:Uncharacterized protein n=1 Tax=Streptomyces termitum TaxID=67368 RepID=A0A918WB92_9ACTN|nr:hypothetical protein GCM10010305_41190 [Streptomyces termitum]